MTRGRKALLAVAGTLALLAAALGGWLLAEALDDDAGGEPAPAPQVVIREQQQRGTGKDTEATEDLGFPAFATKNTTRISGSDPVADAAAVALAVFPSTGGIDGPAAVSIVAEDDWQAGVAAAVLMAEPVRAPVLVSGADEVPALAADALAALAPGGSGATDDEQAFVIGDAAAPDDLRTLEVKGKGPAQAAAEVARLRRELTGEDPEHVVLVSADEPGFAMPAASWAARSGDPVLYLERKRAPAETIDELERYDDATAYVLGPESAISAETFAQVKKAAADAKRIPADDPVQSAIAFARFADGSFGWNINDPGHGFVIANASRPMDAAAAAALSASGTWGPLLVTDESETPPEGLRGYLLDLKPGYESDPTRALYNHVWLIGNQEAISVPFQSQVDELAEVAEVSTGSGESSIGQQGGDPEAEQPKAGGSGPGTKQGR